MRRFVYAQGGDGRPDQGMHFGDIDSGRPPYDSKVDDEVVVDELVTDAGDLPPRNLGVRRDEIARHTPGSLTEDLEFPDDRVLNDQSRSNAAWSVLASSCESRSIALNMCPRKTASGSGIEDDGGASQDRLPQVRTQARLRHHVDRPSEERLQLVLEAEQFEEALWRPEID